MKNNKTPQEILHDASWSITRNFDYLSDSQKQWFTQIMEFAKKYKRLTSKQLEVLVSIQEVAERRIDNKVFVVEPVGNVTAITTKPKSPALEAFLASFEADQKTKTH